MVGPVDRAGEFECRAVVHQPVDGRSSGQRIFEDLIPLRENEAEVILTLLRSRIEIDSIEDDLSYEYVFTPVAM